MSFMANAFIYMSSFVYATSILWGKRKESLMTTIRCSKSERRSQKNCFVETKINFRDFCFIL